MRERRGIEFEALEQQCVELRFDGSDGHVLAVGGLVGVVERSAGVEEIDAALVGPDAATAECPHHVGEREGSVDHRRVDDLALTGRRALDESRQNAEDQEHGTAAEIADHVERRDGTFTLASDGVEDTGQ